MAGFQIEAGAGLAREDQLAALIVAEQGYILTASENGFGKLTPLEDFPTHGRGGQGVIALQVTDRNGRMIGALQVSAAHKANLSPTLLAAANSSGGVLGKMISPQNLAIGAAAVGLSGREGDLFRRVVGWSIVLMLLMCVIVYLQSTSLLSWMVP